MAESALTGTKVKRLPNDLANQIAAGEVVERPASVVKELVENSLDAGATRVRVELDHGGLSRIRITDDGEGMSADDARLAIERHATSKIARIEDLTRIATFGFRGEALPSIASVARMTLTTRARGLAEGIELIVEGGGEPRVKPTGCAEGTSIEVRDLFFNVPARRKFLKAQGTEAAHVGEIVLLAALARPDVTFVLARDGRVAREYLRVATRGERVAQALNGEPRLEACEGARGPMRVEAHLAPPERARAGTVALHLFVNGRPVKDRQLARAVANAYGSVLEPGRYPVGVVYIELPPEQVDVNVHPQKAEVRFQDARALFDALVRELHASLARAFAIPALPGRGGWIPPAARGGVQPAAASMPTTWHAGDVGTRGAPGDVRRDPPFVPAPGGARGSTSEPDPWGLAAPDVSSPPPPVNEGLFLAIPEPASAPPDAAPTLFARPGFYGSLHFLAQLRATFLLCEGDDALYILDQHAAAERVTFDRLRRAFAERSVAVQRLLVPEVVELVPAEVAVLEDAQDEVLSLGVELRAVGTSAVAVHSVPQLLARARPERIVRDLAAELGRAAKRPFRDAADLVLATMACHGSIRAGDAIAPDEARALLAALDRVDFAGHCPHGRPVVTRTAFEELERRVGR
jgi:DNA mismatch repair protein MutL